MEFRRKPTKTPACQTHPDPERRLPLGFNELPVIRAMPSPPCGGILGCFSQRPLFPATIPFIWTTLQAYVPLASTGGNRPEPWIQGCPSLLPSPHLKAQGCWVGCLGLPSFPWKPVAVVVHGTLTKAPQEGQPVPATWLCSSDSTCSRALCLGRGGQSVQVSMKSCWLPRDRGPS